MSDQPIETRAVAQEVEMFIDKEIEQVAKYENRQHMDESATFSLHQLAAQIYAMGWRDGAAVGADNERRAIRRVRRSDG